MEEIAAIFRAPLATARRRRVGIEIERIGMWKNGDALHYDPYESSGGKRPGAEQLLLNLHEKTGWPLVESSLGRPIGLKSSEGKVSLEPGSQLELSTEPLSDLDALVESSCFFERQVNQVTEPWGLKWIGLGLNPLHKVEDIDLISATRYQFMTDYLGARDTLGTKMMRLTTSVQINLDYESEAEGMEMLRVALLAAPFSYALFGNSPFSEGKNSSFLSYRGEIWRRTDPDRTGLLANVFEKDFGFEAYAKMVWHCPLMFAQNDNEEYVPAKGLSLAEIAKGKLPGVHINMMNRMNAIREIFTEARLKPGYIEIRSIDGQRPDYRYGATAFWMGLIYGAGPRRWAMENLGKISAPDREKLMGEAIRHGLDAQVPGVDFYGLAQDLVAQARIGLLERGRDEARYLRPIEANVKRKMNPAKIALEKFQGEWKENWESLIDYSSICTDDSGARCTD